MSAAALLILAAHLASSPELGQAEGRCRPGEDGPAFLVQVAGLKDRRGRLKLELYPANDRDFLQDDNVLIEQGKTFRRVDVPVPPRGPVELCIRAPGPGRYALSLLHDRDSNRKFGLTVDGVGFPGNPRLGWGRPKAAQAIAEVGSSPARLSILLNYRSGLFAFRPVGGS